MNDAQGKRLLIASFVVAIAVISWQEIRDRKEFPRPQRYIGGAVAYGMLGVLAEGAAPLAGIIGAGLVVGLVALTQSNKPKRKPLAISISQTEQETW